MAVLELSLATHRLKILDRNKEKKNAGLIQQCTEKFPLQWYIARYESDEMDMLELEALRWASSIPCQLSCATEWRPALLKFYISFCQSPW